MTNASNQEPNDLDLLLDTGSDEELRSFLRLLQRDELSELLLELLPDRRARLVSFLHPAETAELLTLLPEEQWPELIDALGIEGLSAILAELDDPEIQRVLELIQHQRLPRLIAEMESDDAADVLGELPQGQVQAILAQLPDEDAEPIEQLLQYPEDSAGGLMQTELIRVHKDCDVAACIEEIREQAAREDDLDFYEVYVVDREDRLFGKVGLDSLILASSDTPVEELVEPELYWVEPLMDQEEVANVFQRYDLVTLPVIDAERQLLGRITVDDIVDVIEEEASEDILQLAGANKEDLVYDRILRSAVLRLPWLFTNLGGGLLTGYLMWLYKATLSEIMAIITFVPVITGMGGNVGTQSSSITVRGFAINRIDLSNFGRYLFKEMRVGGIMGSVCGLSLCAIGWLWHGNVVLGLVVGLSLFLAMTLAAITGSLFPAFFQLIKVDPALASGPFVTTINDVTGILIYLGTATFCRAWLIG